MSGGLFHHSLYKKGEYDMNNKEFMEKISNESEEIDYKVILQEANEYFNKTKIVTNVGLFIFNKFLHKFFRLFAHAI